ncbi:plasmid mobilization relaxosome protein MobC [Pedobacter psychrodurus]|uniref:Plasmid mobilization relaxosome protein MobC n=1 Tax=Pedobacter psychrodurus TaxID=2530456 RepID=A0A4V2MRA4_9SPHI|nr:plasmid mobilization relaxosome protein MobC [Pedobacter psychrodurus]TCD28737.1 plasmid mobilization relaxosome protein MobC [Pedobacter psychrodurus]
MNKKQLGRPPMVRGKRDKKIDVRFTKEEFELILKLEKTLGVSKADLIRNKILIGSERVIINAGQLILALDLLGTEMGRVGNNINQLARYSNALNRQGILSVVVAERYNILLMNYQEIQKRLEVLLRRVIRLSGK